MQNRQIMQLENKCPSLEQAFPFPFKGGEVEPRRHTLVNEINFYSYSIID
jgi:hypothetical protein